MSKTMEEVKKDKPAGAAKAAAGDRGKPEPGTAAAKPVNKGKKPKALSGAKLKVTLVKSTAGRLIGQKRTVEALGLSKIRSFALHGDNPAIRGMIFKVRHLVEVEEIK